MNNRRAPKPRGNQARKPVNGPARDLRFDWSLVQSFLAVIDTGSLLAASRQLGMSQPTIGRHIESLESQLGVALFERTGRGLVPTTIAWQITDHARQMQHGADDLARRVFSTGQSQGGLVRVAASRMIAVHHMPSIVTNIQALYPRIDIAVVASDRVTNLLRRDADIAVRMVQPRQNTLIARRIGAIGIVPYASQQYLARWGMPRSPMDLLQHRLVGADRDKQFVESMRAFARRFEVDESALRIVFRSDDFVSQLEAVRAGLGIGFSSRAAVVRQPELVRLPFDLPIPPLPVWLAVHREIRTNTTIRQVFDALATELSGLVDPA